QLRLIFSRQVRRFADDDVADPKPHRRLRDGVEDVGGRNNQQLDGSAVPLGNRDDAREQHLFVVGEQLVRAELVPASVRSTQQAPVNKGPEIVAVSLVKRLMTAAANRQIAMSATPIGSSRPPTRTLKGTFHPRGLSGSL